MTGPHLIPLQVPFFPAYIPPEIDMTQVKADVADDGVSVPPADQADVPALRQVVDDARGEGIDLKIVVIDVNPPIDTPLRDIATEVGEANPGSTVLALSPIVRRHLQPDVRSGDAGSRPGSRQNRRPGAVVEELSSAS